MWEKLQTQMAQLPQTKHQARRVLRWRRSDYLQPLRSHWKQVYYSLSLSLKRRRRLWWRMDELVQVVDNSRAIAGKNGQRHKELLEHKAEEEIARKHTSTKASSPPTNLSSASISADPVLAVRLRHRRLVPAVPRRRSGGGGFSVAFRLPHARELQSGGGDLRRRSQLQLLRQRRHQSNWGKPRVSELFEQRRRRREPEILRQQRRRWRG